MLKPIDLPETHFREQLALMMSEVRIAHLDNRLPALGPTKKQIEKVRQALKRLSKRLRPFRLMREWHNLSTGMIFVDYLMRSQIQLSIITAISELEKAALFPNSAKHEAAKFAFELLIWKNELPAKTINGTFYELSSTLYEGGTGIAGADLQRVCRFVINSLLASGRAEQAPGDATQKGGAARMRVNFACRHLFKNQVLECDHGLG